MAVNKNDKYTATIVRFYVSRVKYKRMTIDEVPEPYRELVREALGLK